MTIHKHTSSPIISIFRSTFLGLVMLFIAAPLMAATNPVVEDILKSNVGVRAIGMGGAYTAVAWEEGALIYNPAGLAEKGGLYRFENMDYQRRYLNDFSANFVYLSPFGYARWSKTNSLNQTADVNSFSYARKGDNGIDWGITYKTVGANDGTTQINGWSSDIGLLFHMNKNMHLGLVGKDVFSDKLDAKASGRVGFAYTTDDRGMVLSTDVEYREINGDADFSSSAGLEWTLSQGFMLRTGIDGSVVSGGGSIVLPILDISWAVQSDVQVGGEPIYSLGFKFGKGVTVDQVRRKYSLFKQNAFAEFALGGNLVGGKSEISLLGGGKIGSNDLLSLIRMANKDDTCDGFIIRIGNLSSSLGSVALIQELREELTNAKIAGKTVIAYIESWATLPEYYLASVANKVIMPELGVISHLGLSMELRKTKSLLSRWGMDYQVLSQGKYKANTLPYSKDVDDDGLFVLEELVNNLYRQVLLDIKQSRELNWVALGDIFDGRLISGTKAKEIGLVDELGYWESAKLSATPSPNPKNEEPSIEPLGEFATAPSGGFIFEPANKIAVIEIDGPINLGRSHVNPLFGGKVTGAEDITDQIEEIAESNTIQGVILRINSPGGSLIATDRIYSAINTLRESGKIVYTSLGNMAASGGYYLALNSERIYSNPGTLTGSIGVITILPNMKSLNEFLGVETTSIKTGEYMDMGNASRPLTEDELAMFQEHQKESYDTFLSKVMSHRNLSREEAVEVAQGQLFTGKQAKELHLVDRIGGFYDVVDDMSKEINISDPELVYYRPENDSVWVKILQFFNQML